jgi:hypothetical protein
MPAADITQLGFENVFGMKNANYPVIALASGVSSSNPVGATQALYRRRSQPAHWKSAADVGLLRLGFMVTWQTLHRFRICLPLSPTGSPEHSQSAR